MKRILCYLISIVCLCSNVVFAENESEKAVFISAGGGHSMVINDKNELWAIGRYSYQYEKETDSENPTGNSGMDFIFKESNYKEVQHIPHKVMDNVTFVSAGTRHTLAITANNELWAFGRNSVGQLGDGNNGSDRYEQNPKKIMDNIIFATAGGGHSLAIDSKNQLYSWGWNLAGELLDGTQKSTYKPAKVMSGVKYAVAGDKSNSFIIKTNGELWGVGWNTYGQLGNGENSQSINPIKIMNDVKKVVTANGAVLALKETGELWSWGNNDFGQLGDGSLDNKNRPIKVMDGVMDIAIGSNCGYALLKNNELWGFGKSVTQYFDKSTQESTKTVPIKILDNVVSVSATVHTLALKSDGNIYGWGGNGSGQLGIKYDDGIWASNIIDTPTIIYYSGIKPSNESENVSTVIPDGYEKQVVLQLNNTDVIINGVKQNTDVPPVLINDRTYVPIRIVAELLDFEVLWIPESEMIELKNNENIIQLQINSNKANVNGSEKLMDNEPLIYKERTLVPLRFIGEAIGANVSWNEEMQEITILK